MSYTSTFKKQIKNFHPAYFALVMSTGIISVAFHLSQYEMVSKMLFLLNNLQYLVLLFIFFVRLVFFFSAFKTDLAAHARGAGFLTFVAGSCILGTEYTQHQNFQVAIFLLLLSLIAWVLMLYSFLTLIILKQEKPSLEKGINGSWLLIVVSTQSLVILGTLAAPHLPVPTNIILFSTLSAWLFGILQYFIFITIIIYRLTFYPVTAKEISPSYWIDTGAAAISTLAGATIINALAGVAAYHEFIPFIKAISLLLWAAATWWLPLLFVLETWRHIKTGFKYSADYWSLVFPLGMYTVATIKLAEIMQTAFLNSISHVFIFIAWAAWLITFIVMISKIPGALADRNTSAT